MGRPELCRGKPSRPGLWRFCQLLPPSLSCFAFPHFCYGHPHHCPPPFLFHSFFSSGKGPKRNFVHPSICLSPQLNSSWRPYLKEKRKCALSLCKYKCRNTKQAGRQANTTEFRQKRWHVEKWGPKEIIRVDIMLLKKRNLFFPLFSFLPFFFPSSLSDKNRLHQRQDVVNHFVTSLCQPHG